MKKVFLTIVLGLFAVGCENPMGPKWDLEDEESGNPGPYWTCSDSWVKYFSEYQCESQTGCPENGEECVYSGD
jgi:hypothetical protein